MSQGISYGGRVLAAGVRRTLIVQAAITAAITVAFLMLEGPQEGLGAVYGGGISLLITALLGWRIQRASEFHPTTSAVDRGQGAVQLYIGAFERFIVVGAGFGLGIALLKLPPLAMVLGFAVAQMSFLFRVPTRLELTQTESTKIESTKMSSTNLNSTKKPGVSS